MPGNERIIDAVKNTKDKQITYTKMLGRYKLAMKYGFYFEAMLIVYAMLEDRLRSYLYYMGVLNTRDARSISKRTKPQLINIIMDVENTDKEPMLKISTISGKIKIVTDSLLWTSTAENVEDKYLILLKKQIEGVDIGGMLEIIKELEDWLKFRNQVVHASMHKNIISLYEQLPEMTEKGMEYARYIDGQVRIMKKSNIVRRSMKMGNT